MAELPLGEFNTAPCRWRPEGCWASHERVTVSSLITGARLDRMQRALGTLSEVLARVQGFHNELQQELSKVPFYDLGSRLQRWFGGELPARIRKVETIREAIQAGRERYGADLEAALGGGEAVPKARRSSPPQGRI